MVARQRYICPSRDANLNILKKYAQELYPSLAHGVINISYFKDVIRLLVLIIDREATLTYMCFQTGPLFELRL